MDAESFERIMTLVWGGAHGIRWEDASADLGPGPRTLQRWASGKNEIPDWMIGRVYEALRAHATTAQSRVAAAQGHLADVTFACAIIDAVIWSENQN